MSFIRNNQNPSQKNTAVIKAKEKKNTEYFREVESTIFYFDINSYLTDSTLRDFCINAISELDALRSNDISFEEMSARCAALRDEYSKLSESICPEKNITMSNML